MKIVKIVLPGISILCISSAFVLFLMLKLLPPEKTALESSILRARKPQIIGFQPYWLVGKGKDTYSKDLTTLTYFGLAVASDGGIIKEENPGEQEPGYAMLQNEEYQKYLKEEKDKGVTLSLLLQNMIEEDIMALVATPSSHATNLMSEIVPIMRSHGFTDLNLDIENFVKSTDSARLGYTQFVKEIKDTLVREKLGTLTVELTPKSPIEKHLIDVQAIGEIADTLILMAYDYHTIFSAVAGPVAPIGGVPTTSEYDVETALVETLKYVPKEKLVLGIPLYGYEWETLSSVAGSAVIPGSWQTATNKRAEEYIASMSGIVQRFDEIAKEPYLIFPGETPNHFQQVFYEDAKALDHKLALAKKYKLKGVAFWAVGYEGKSLLTPLSSYKNSIQWVGFPTKKSTETLPIQPFALNPPTSALIGMLSQKSGGIQLFGRNDDEYHDIGQTSTILQGESLATDETGKGMITLPDIATLSMLPNSELRFPELIPPNIALRQSNGTVVYTLLSDAPLFFRVLRSLVMLEKGTATAQIEGTQATVFINDGSARLGNIDKDNNTSTYFLNTGDTAHLDEEEKAVTIR